MLGHSKRAARVKSDFKVPDRRYWFIKVKALAQLRDWAALEKFAKEKKSPIGYGPFAQVCIEANAIKEADKYIARIQDPAERVDLYCRTGNWAEAIETARGQKDNSLLLDIKSKYYFSKVIADEQGALTRKLCIK